MKTKPDTSEDSQLPLMSTPSQTHPSVSAPTSTPSQHPYSPSSAYTSPGLGVSSAYTSPPPSTFYSEGATGFPWNSQGFAGFNGEQNFGYQRAASGEEH